MANPIMWLEFVCTDSGATKQFYSELFGWEFTDFMPGYTTFAAEGGPGGGFRENTPEGTPQTVAYIGVDSIDATLARIAAAGGEVVVPRFQVSPEVGFLAFFKDPNGNIVGLHSMAP